MAAVRGGQAKPVKPPAPKMVAPKIPKGTNVTNNPWNLNIPGLQNNDGHGGIIPQPAAPPPARGGEAAPVAPPTPATPIDWAAVLALDPGYTATKAQTDANIASLNEQYSGAANPFSTIKQLQLSLNQNLRSNANAHASHGTLFGGGTAQGAANHVRDNTKAGYDAANAHQASIGAQNSLLAQELSAATNRALANPDRYGISSTAPGDPVEVAQNQGPAAPPPPAAAAAAKPFVTAKQLAINPRAAQTKKNNRF